MINLHLNQYQCTVNIKLNFINSQESLLDTTIMVMYVAVIVMNNVFSGLYQTISTIKTILTK